MPSTLNTVSIATATHTTRWSTTITGLPGLSKADSSQGDQGWNTAVKETAVTNDTKGVIATLINANHLHLAKHAPALECIRQRWTAATLPYQYTTSEPGKKLSANEINFLTASSWHLSSGTVAHLVGTI